MKAKLLFPFRLIGTLIGFIKDLFRLFINHFYESIRLQLIVTFVICLLASVFVYSLSGSFFGEYYKTATISYSDGMESIDRKARRMMVELTVNDLDPQQIQEAIDSAHDGNLKILVLDLDGKVLYKSKNATETQVDLHSIIRNAMDARLYRDSGQREFSSFYPFDLDGQKAYLVVSGIPEPSISYISSEGPMPLLAAFAAFILLFYFMTQKKMRTIEELAKGLREISKGNLDYRVREKSRDELGSLAKNINRMTEELQRTIEEERRAEKTKSELITNVSHDLRTPLTLIMGYLRLLKDKNFEDERQAEHYLHVAYNKSEKMKVLIDDLFEYTKLSNQGVKLFTRRVCLNELLEQLMEELVSFALENDLAIVRDFTAERIMADIDADKMIRVFENLLTNAIKYSYKPGAVTVKMRKEQSAVHICMENRGTPLSPEDLSRLFDRFYRVEKSRSSETGGSGLGLAIAKSIVELHGGKIWAECEGEQIRFCVELKLA